MNVVMSKRVYDLKPKPQASTGSKWHKANGTLTVEGVELYDRIYDMLDTTEAEFGYSQIRDGIAGAFPDEYTASPGSVDIKDGHGKVVGKRILISNMDIKIIVMKMVEDGLAVE